MPYTGCHIVVFDGELGVEGDRILNRISSRAKEFLQIGGIRVAVLEEKFESDLWKLHVAFPHANMIVAATDEAFMTQVLARRLDGSPRVALPEHLPEWRVVDRSAPFWAVRHYSPSSTTQDHSSPYHPHSQAFTDPGAIGFGVSVFGKTLRMGYLTTTASGHSLLEKMWNVPAQELESTIRPSGPQVFEVVPQLDSVNAEGACQLRLLLMLGHGIYL